MPNAAHESGLKIKYGTVDEGGDARAILASSLAMVSLVEAVCADIEPDARLEIRVQSPESGSVIIGFHLLPQFVDVGKVVFAAGTLTVVGKVLTVITKIIEIRKKLHGEPPKQVENQPNSNVVVIVNARGDEIRTDVETYRAYENVGIAASANAVFEPLAETDTVTRWDLLDLSDRPLATVEQESFSAMAAGTAADSDEVQYATQKITVPIIKPSFEKNLLWDISFFGDRRSVRITDSAFWDRIEKGEQFGKGDSLDVELRVKKVYDHHAGVYLAKEYEIVKVYNHIPRPVQSGTNISADNPTNLTEMPRGRRFNFNKQTDTVVDTSTTEKPQRLKK